MHMQPHQFDALTLEHIWNPSLAEAQRIITTTRPFRQDDVNWMMDQLTRLHKRAPELFLDSEISQLEAIVGGSLKRRGRSQRVRVIDDAQEVIGLLREGKKIGPPDLDRMFGWSKSRANYALAKVREVEPSVKSGHSPNELGGRGHRKYWLEGVAR